MAEQLINGFTTTIPGTLGTGDTTMTLATGKGALLPSSGGNFHATICSTVADALGNPTLKEIVLCTAVSGDVVSITRAQEGTTAISGTGLVVVFNPSAGAMNAWVQSSTGKINAKTLGVKGDGILIRAAAAMSASSTTVVVTGASFTSKDVGKTFVVVGASTTGYDITGTISSVTNSTTAVLSTAAGTSNVSGLDFWYGTDDTAAIQSAINTVFALNGPALYFPTSIYIVAGTPSTGAGALWTPATQIQLPFADPNLSQRTLTIVGDSITGPGNQAAATDLSTAGTVFLSTATQTNNLGYASKSVFGSPANVTGYQFSLSGTLIVAKNLQVVLLQDSGITGFDFQGSACVDFDALSVIQTTQPRFYKQPANVNYGIRMPAVNNQAICRGIRSFVAGTYFGTEMAEHTHLIDPWYQSCFAALVISNLQNHYIHVDHAIIDACPYGLIYNAPATVFMTASIEKDTDGEFAPTWASQIADLHDVNNYAAGGYFLWHHVTQAIGADSAFVSDAPANSKMLVQSMDTLQNTFPKRWTMWHQDSLVTHGNALTTNYGSGALYYITTLQNPPANGDTFTNGFYVQAGTYTLSLTCSTGNNFGKLDLYVDGTVIQTGMDFYTGSFVPAAPAMTSTSFTVKTSGWHQFKGVVNGKNASSSDYNILLSKIAVVPTAD